MSRLCLVIAFLALAPPAIAGEIRPPAPATATAEISDPGVSPEPDPLLCLPIEVTTLPDEADRSGTAVPVGEREALSAAHVVSRPVRGFQGTLMAREPRWLLRVAGAAATLTAHTRSDLVAVRVALVRERFSVWVEPGSAVTGTAYIVRHDVVRKIEITNTVGQAFVGYRPIRGESGSGIVQRRGGRWVVVGVVVAKVCDGCPRCDCSKDAARWACHCPPGGFYGRIEAPPPR